MREVRHPKMRRRSPLALVPLAFLTLACGSPVGNPPLREATPPAAPAPAKSAPASPKPARSSDEPRSKESSTTQTAPAGSIRYGVKDPLPKKTGSLRLATYNLENLFDDKDDPKISGAIDDKTMTTPAARLAGLAEAIKRLDADVLALEEVESKEALLQFRDGYLQGLGYDFLASLDAGDGRGIEQSVLSRIPIEKVENWPNEAIADMDAKRTGPEWTTINGPLPKRWARSPLMVDLRSKDGYELTLFVVHHKAGGKEFAGQRELEALQVVEFAKARLAKEPNRRIAILGDFNSTPNFKTVGVYSSAGFKSAYEKRFDRKATPETYITHSTHRAIDYIFMSPSLDADAIDRSFFVLGTPLPPEDASEDILVKGYASDHMPIAIDLLPKAGKTVKNASTGRSG